MDHGLHGVHSLLHWFLGDGSRIPGREPEPCESSGHLVRRAPLVRRGVLHGEISLQNKRIDFGGTNSSTKRIHVHDCFCLTSNAL